MTIIGNPLLLRHPLNAGVKVIAAHCATEGKRMNSPKRIVINQHDHDNLDTLSQHIYSYDCPIDQITQITLMTLGHSLDIDSPSRINLLNILRSLLYLVMFLVCPIVLAWTLFGSPESLNLDLSSDQSGITAYEAVLVKFTEIFWWLLGVVSMGVLAGPVYFGVTYFIYPTTCSPMAALKG